jgi:hypothetical protein
MQQRARGQARMKKCPRGPRGCVRHIFWVCRPWFLEPCGLWWGVGRPGARRPTCWSVGVLSQGPVAYGDDACETCGVLLAAFGRRVSRLRPHASQPVEKTISGFEPFLNYRLVNCVQTPAFILICRLSLVGNLVSALKEIGNINACALLSLPSFPKVLPQDMLRGFT